MEELVLSWLQGGGFWLYMGAFSAGAITSLAPCSIVSVPLLVGSALGLSAKMNEKSRFLFSLLFSLLFASGVATSFFLLALLVAKAGFLFSIAPMWAYGGAGVLAMFLGFYAMGWLPEVIHRATWFERLLAWRWIGVFGIGVIFGLVSTPCASAPLVAIITLASTLEGREGYIAVLLFALGHSLLLLVAGVWVSFAQKIASSSFWGGFSTLLRKILAWMMLAVAGYFFYQGWLQV